MPAPASTATSCPRLISSSAPAGVSATRYSSDLISFATPILTAPDDTGLAALERDRRLRGEQPRIMRRLDRRFDDHIHGHRCRGDRDAHHPPLTDWNDNMPHGQHSLELRHPVLIQLH